MRRLSLLSPALIALTLLACADKDSSDDSGSTDDSAADDSAADDSAADDSATENTAPTAPEVAVSPSHPFDDDALTCQLLAEATDAEGDAITYSYAWQVDGADAGLTGDTVPADQTAPDEVWTCAVTPNDGALDGPTAESSATVQRCSGLRFDGRDDYVELDDVDWSAFTIEAWVYVDDASGLSAIVSDLVNEGSHVYQNVEMSINAGSLGLSLGDTGSWTHLVSANTLSEGQWHHVAAMYDGSTATLAIDGVIDGNTASVSMVQEDTPLYIGARPSNQGERAFHFNGVIDGVRISEGARYTANFTPPEALPADASTLAAWGFDEGSGGSLGDDVGSHDGTINGATWSTGCVAIDNAPPSAPTVSVSPDAPHALDTLTCAIEVDANDPNGDEISYDWAWWVDGLDAGVTGDTVDASLTEEGETWTCAVTPFDGKVDGPTGTASVTVDSCYALDFDGVDDVVELGDVSWSAFTVEAWVYLDDTSGLHAVVSDLHNEGGSYYQNVELSVGDGNILLSLGDGSGWSHLRSAQTVSAGQWHHIAGMYDGTGSSLAIDGVIDTNTATLTMAEQSVPLLIGARPSNEGVESFHLDGKVAGVRLSSTARYTADFTPSFPLAADADTSALWRLSEGSGTAAGASVGADGLIDGASWAIGCPGE